MAKLSEALEKITETKTHKKDRNLEKYKEKCLAHWATHSKSILLYFEELKTGYSDCIFINFSEAMQNTALKTIPHWSYAPSNNFADNFPLYLDALNISYNLVGDFNVVPITTKGLSISLNAELPECTQIPNEVF